MLEVRSAVVLGAPNAVGLGISKPGSITRSQAVAGALWDIETLESRHQTYPAGPAKVTLCSILRIARESYASRLLAYPLIVGVLVSAVLFDPNHCQSTRRQHCVHHCSFLHSDSSSNCVFQRILRPRYHFQLPSLHHSWNHLQATIATLEFFTFFPSSAYQTFFLQVSHSHSSTSLY